MKLYSKLAAAVAAFALVVVPGQVPDPASAQAPGAARGVALPAAIQAEDEPQLYAMGDYSLSKFSAEARRLDGQLADALERDLGITPEEYLAGAAAAADSIAVVDALREAGVEVLGSSIDGTDLTINVASAADVAAVEAVGAAAVIGEQVVPEFGEMKLAENLAGGQPIYYETTNGQGYVCSLGFIGNRMSDGRDQATTAGHCTAPNLTYGGVYTKVHFSEPDDSTPALGEDIGAPVAGKFLLGGGNDAGVLDITSNANLSPLPYVDTWNGGSGGTDILYNSVYDRLPAVVGNAICKSGATTGWTCGNVLAIDQRIDVEGSLIDLVITSACVKPGDSGGTAVYGFAAMGITSSSTWGSGDSCASPGESGFFPMISQNANRQSVHKALGNIWEPAVTVQAPVVMSPTPGGSVAWGSSMTGLLPSGTIRHTVEVFIDGSGTPRTATVSQSGTWSVNLAGVAPGAHTYSLRGKWGKWSLSSAVNGTFTVGAAPVVDRLAGADRYAVGVSVSKALFPNPGSGVPVVFLADGAKFPDALSSAPAAVEMGGPLLLTPSASLPTAVRNEIIRLNPDKIVISGGPASVSNTIFNQLTAIVGAGNVTRLGGSDRYAVSRAVIDHAWDVGAAPIPVVYVTTGVTYPDALSASAAAGDIGAPVLLVQGTSSTLDAATRAILDRIDPTTIKVAGGSVSTGIRSALAAYGSVVFLGGADRFAASQTINADAFTSSTDVYLTSGFVFADGLAGAALAGSQGAPLYTVPSNCVPAGVLQQIGQLGATRVHLLGGTGTLTSNVFALKSC